MYVGRITERKILLYLTSFLVLTSCNGLIRSLNVLNGSLTIAGIFEIQTTGNDGTCSGVQVGSVMAMEAVRWYLESVNNNGTQPFTIGLSVYKTCGILGYAGDAAVDIISRYRRSTDTKASEDFIIGVVGPEYSSETQVVSSILGSQTTSDRLLQIGFSSTSTDLNDRVRYPNFFRVVSDDKVQISVMLQLMYELKWNRIAILYVNDTYGRDGANMLMEHAVDYHICISKSDVIELDSNRQIRAADVQEILLSYVTKAPRIEGVVYFGNTPITNQVLQIFDGLQMADVPIFILSESSLQDDIFYSATDKLFTKTKGTLALSLPHHEVTEFKRYWESLFTNKSALQNALHANPFLKDVFRQYAGCDFNSLDCNALNEIQIREKAFQSVYVHYAIYATHTLVEAMKTFKKSQECRLKCTTIGDLKDTFQPFRLIEAMDGLSVAYGGVRASYSKNSSQVHLADGEKEYEVYNFRKDPADTETFTFVNVGYVTDGNLVLNTDKIKDYGSDGSERGYSNLRRGQCPVGEMCNECRDSDAFEINYHIPGDFYVVGLVSINNQAIRGPLGCGTVRTRHGYQMYLSLQFALKEFQTRSWYAHYNEMFAGKSVGLIVINTCNNALEVVPKILELHSKGLRLSNGTYLDLENRILGYVGGQAADVSEPAATQLTKLKVVQISYTSTNSVLSDKKLYPYFLRIISSDSVQAKAMIDIVKDLGGEYIQLVFSEGDYGEGFRDCVRAAAVEADVCVAQTIKVKESDTYFEYFEILRQKPHAKIVLVLLRSHVVGPFLRDVKKDMKRGEFHFIGSEAWGKNKEVLKYDITQGAIITAVEMDKDRDLEYFIKRQKPEYNVSNPWLENYIQNRQDCYYSWSYDKTFSRECTDDILPIFDPDFESDPWCIFVVNTMLAFLKGAAIFYNSQCGSSAGNLLCADFVENPDEFFKVLRNVKINIYGTGEILVFDENGDGLMGYKIYNIQTKNDDKTSRVYSLIGSYSPNGGLNFEKEKMEYPRTDPILSECPSQLACRSCLGDNSTGSVATNRTPTTLALVLAVLSGVLAIVVVILGVILFMKLKKKQKKYDNGYITPTYMGERPSAIGGHSGSDTSYVTANPMFEND